MAQLKCWLAVSQNVYSSTHCTQEWFFSNARLFKSTCPNIFDLVDCFTKSSQAQVAKNVNVKSDKKLKNEVHILMLVLIRLLIVIDRKSNENESCGQKMGITETERNYVTAKSYLLLTIDLYCPLNEGRQLAILTILFKSRRHFFLPQNDFQLLLQLLVTFLPQSDSVRCFKIQDENLVYSLPRDTFFSQDETNPSLHKWSNVFAF